MTVVRTQGSDEDSSYFNMPGVAVVRWNPDLRAVCVEMQGWANTGEAQTMLDAIIRTLSAHHGSRWLLDGRNMKVIKQSDQDWITQNWLPRAAAAGLKMAAVVLPTSMVAMTNVEDVERVSDNGIDARFFPTIEQAEEWLSGPAALTKRSPGSEAASGRREHHGPRNDDPLLP